MGTLKDRPENGFEGAVHLLLVGPSKTGKTHYVAELIKDGFTVLYIDNDNGLNTLRRKLPVDALDRVHYVETRNIWEFATCFFGRKRFQWNETQDILFNPKTANDDDKILEIMTKEIPLGVVVVIDSWTSIKIQLLLDSAAKNGVDYEVFNDAGQNVYGDGNRRADLLCMNIQSFPGHVIVQAHQEQYEMLEKAKGVMKEVAKQNQMIVKGNWTIPVSVSRPHGFAMPKFFNEVGYMRVGAMGDFKLDFRQLPDRVGGGTPMKEGDPSTEMRFSRIFAKPMPDPGGWIRTVDAVVFKEEEAQAAEERKRKAEEAKAAKANATPQAGTKSALPGKGLL